MSFSIFSMHKSLHVYKNGKWGNNVQNVAQFGSFTISWSSFLIGDVILYNDC